jgi:hypothetical protein
VRDRATTLAHVSKPVVRAQDLLVGYGGAPVCAPVSFTLAPGKVLALVGANGSGKSTVLRSVIGLLEPSGGSLQVFGAPVDERDVGFRTRVSSVLDDDAYFPALTVSERILLQELCTLLGQPTRHPVFQLGSGSRKVGWVSHRCNRPPICHMQFSPPRTGQPAHPSWTGTGQTGFCIPYIHIHT